MVSFWCKLTAAAGHERHRQTRLKSKLHLGGQLEFGMRQILYRCLVYLGKRQKLFDQSEMTFRLFFSSKIHAKISLQ